MKFTDKNGRQYKIWMREQYHYIRSEQCLKATLDAATNVSGLRKRFPSLSEDGLARLSEAYKGKCYIQILNDLGMASKVRAAQ